MRPVRGALPGNLCCLSSTLPHPPSRPKANVKKTPKVPAVVGVEETACGLGPGGTVESGPIPAIHEVVRWRLIDLVQWLHDEFAVLLDETIGGRELKKLGYVKLTARPRHHAQNEYAMAAFKKGASPPSWQNSGIPSRRASRQRSGSRTKPGSVRRTRSHGAGRGAGHGHRRRRTSERNRPTSSIRSHVQTALPVVNAACARETAP